MGTFQFQINLPEWSLLSQPCCRSLFVVGPPERYRNVHPQLTSAAEGTLHRTIRGDSRSKTFQIADLSLLSWEAEALSTSTGSWVPSASSAGEASDSVFRRFLPTLLWYSWISSSNPVRCERGSQVALLFGNPFHQTKYWSTPRSDRNPMMLSTGKVSESASCDAVLRLKLNLRTIVCGKKETRSNRWKIAVTRYRSSL